MKRKSTVEEIRERFDNDVDRFANLKTGQSATIDAPIALELVAKAARATTPGATRLLDIGCGGGNFSLRVMELGNYDSVTLVDLSKPMLTRATERISSATKIEPVAIQADIRALELSPKSFDVVVAGAVLHHVRTKDEWRETFSKILKSLDGGGSFWIFDLVTSSIDSIRAMQDKRYGEYLVDLKDEAYRDHVFEYVEKEDTPASLLYQLDLLRDVGFSRVDVLHFNTRFAAFGGVKT